MFVKLKYKKRKTVCFYSVKGFIQYEAKYVFNEQEISNSEFSMFGFGIAGFSCVGFQF